MRFEQVSIAALTHVDAPHRLSSEELEARLEGPMSRLSMSPGVLEQVAGIRARRLWDLGTLPSAAATLAGRAVLEQSGIEAEKIGALISTSVCRDYLEPSTACAVHNALSLGAHCVNFDVGNACLGFIEGMDLVSMMIERGAIDYGMVVDGEGSQEILEKTIARLCAPESTAAEFRANFATLTLGSGAAAMILCRRDLAPNAPRYLGGVKRAATKHHGLCKGKEDFMQTDTKGLLVAGVTLAQQVWAAAKAELGWSPEALDHLILHQVSQVHTQTLAQALGLPLERAHITFDELGNIGPAAVPITLSKAAESGKMSPGQRIALLAIGSGLNCEMAEIEWGTL